MTDIDELIEGLEKLINKKRLIKQGAMQELFGQWRRENTSASLSINGEWRIERLGDILKIGHGKSQHDVVDNFGKYPILGSGGQIGKSNSFLYDKPSVLIGRKGTIDKPQYIDKPFWTIDTLFYSKINENYEPKYIFYRFCLIDWKQYNEASGVPSLSARTIENIEIPLPPTKEEQKAIASILTDMDNEIEMLEKKLEKTKQIKQGMMAELLTGKIRLI